jgi:hypothetical protein
MIKRDRNEAVKQPSAVDEPATGKNKTNNATNTTKQRVAITKDLFMDALTLSAQSAECLAKEIAEWSIVRPASGDLDPPAANDEHGGISFLTLESSIGHFASVLGVKSGVADLIITALSTHVHAADVLLKYMAQDAVKFYYVPQSGT